jgi:hypothetical protein
MRRQYYWVQSVLFTGEFWLQDVAEGTNDVLKMLKYFSVTNCERCSNQDQSSHRIILKITRRGLFK